MLKVSFQNVSFEINYVINKQFLVFAGQKLLLHWSRILGASHSEDYTIWEYGKLASRGVKEICEFGHSNKITQEMRNNVSLRQI